jgi:hypothetical protein
LLHLPAWQREGFSQNLSSDSSQSCQCRWLIGGYRRDAHNHFSYPPSPCAHSSSLRSGPLAGLLSRFEKQQQLSWLRLRQKEVYPRHTAQADPLSKRRRCFLPGFLYASGWSTDLQIVPFEILFDGWLAISAFCNRALAVRPRPLGKGHRRLLMHATKKGRW